MGDTQGDESLVTIQPQQHMMEHESVEEETMHIIHDSPLRESQMEAHIESMTDMWLTLASSVEKEQSDAQTSSTVTVVVDPYPLEILEVDGIVLQDANIQQEHDIPDQERDELLEMVEHPSLGRYKDELQIDAHTVSTTVVLSRSSTLQEYIDGACSISRPLWPFIERGTFFYRQISSTDGTKQRELIWVGDSTPDVFRMHMSLHWILLPR